MDKELLEIDEFMKQLDEFNSATEALAEKYLDIESLQELHDDECES